MSQGPSQTFRLRLSGQWEQGFWVAVVIALMVTGAFELWWGGSRNRGVFKGPDSALEMHVRFVAQSPGALEALRNGLAALPPDKPIKVFAREGMRSAFAEQLVLYLAWPRPVDISGKAPGKDGESFADLQRKYAAMVLCGWNVTTAVPGMTRVGPTMEIIPLTSQDSLSR